jgi:predicted permease
MTRLVHLLARLRAFVRPDPLDRELDEELESHVALLADEHVRRGMTPEAARRAARIAIGGRTQLREAHRDTRGLPFVETLWQDLRYAVRTLRRDAGFTTFGILIVGVGIGASATVFSVVNAVLLRPLPFSQADRLVWVGNLGDDGVSEWSIQVFHFVDLRRQTTTLADMTAYDAFAKPGDIKLTGDGEPERLSGVNVTENFFAFIGVRPALGRFFTPAECQDDGPTVVVLSDRIWRRRFNADPAILGRALVLNDRPVTVVGVLPASFDFASALSPGMPRDLFMPFPLTESRNRWGNTLAVIGRMKPGVTVEQAQAELNVLAEPLTRMPQRNTLRPRLSSLSQHVAGRFRQALAVLVCAVGVVMLIVCANLSNLLLARMAARQKEMAIRVALGAGRRRLVRQVLTESLVLSGCGALLGLALAAAGTRVLSQLQGTTIPLLDRIALDGWTLGVAVASALVTGLVFGIAPALQAPVDAGRRGLRDVLKDGTRGATEGRAGASIRHALVVSEIAFACVLLVGAGLLIRSFLRVLDLDLGFQPARAAALRVEPGTQQRTLAQRNAWLDEMLRRVRAVPGIGAAGLSDVLPLGGDRSWAVAGKGQAYVRGQSPQGFVRVVSDGYLRALGLRLRAGRDLTPQDTPTSEPVIVISETMARTLWPGQEPLGQVMTQDGGRRVVGVVADVRHRALEEAPDAEMYIPMRQTGDYGAVYLVVRTDLPPETLAASVRAALVPLDPGLAAKEWRTLQSLVDKAVSPRLFMVMLLGGFSAFALVLASLGIYAVISYSVGRRTQEIGIRMALGASAREVQMAIIAQTLRLAAIGLFAGAAASWALGRALSGLLFGVSATDPATFLAMLALLAAVAAMAGYLPARRASRIDPIAALRAD